MGIAKLTQYPILSWINFVYCWYRLKRGIDSANFGFFRLRDPNISIGLLSPEYSNSEIGMAIEGRGDRLPKFTEVLVILPFKTVGKNAIKLIFWVFWGSKFQNFFWKSVIFVKIFRKCRNFENRCRIRSNWMYNVVLKLKIGRGNSTISEHFHSPPPLLV